MPFSWQLQGVGWGGYLHAINLSLPAYPSSEAQWWAVVGPNGSGKSLLLQLLAGLLKPTQGTIAPMDTYNPQQRAQQLPWLGATLPVVEPHLSVWDVVAQGRRPHQRLWPRLPTWLPQDEEAVHQALLETEIWDWREQRMFTLSSGQQQRVHLARLRATQSPVMLLDEPIAHLDPHQQGQIVRYFRRWVQGGQTLVTVLHQLPLAMQADGLLIMQQGHLVHQGAPDDPLTQAALHQVFEHQIEMQHIKGQWVMMVV